MRTFTFFIVLAAFVLCRSAEAQCVSSQSGYSVGSANVIGVHTGSSWAACGHDAPPISSAIGLWESGCAGMGGSQFPALADNVGGDIDVTVEFIPGNMPQPTGPDSCARFVPDAPNGTLVGGTIEVWSHTYNGGDCIWVMPHATLDNLIAHELGHAFGLANSECSNNIMGGDWSVASPSSEECDAVDERWDQPDEPEDGGGDGPDPENLDPGGCSMAEFPCSPLVLDLDGDGIQTTSAREWPVVFDINGDGIPHLVGWTDPTTEEGILYFDHNHNKRIDSGKELFGDATSLPDSSRPRNGFEALAWYDQRENGGNGDGVISPSDRVWGKLRLWVDRNHDALMSQDENYSLGAMHILEISVTYGDMRMVDPAGNRHLQQSTFRRRVVVQSWQKIETGAVHDVYFAAAPP